MDTAGFAIAKGGRDAGLYLKYLFEADMQGQLTVCSYPKDGTYTTKLDLKN